MKRLLAGFIFVLGGALAAGAQTAARPASAAAAPAPLSAADAAEHASKVSDIRKLMDIMGSAKMGRQMVDQMFTALRQQMPKVPEEFWKETAAELNPDEMIELIVPVYDRHYSHDDVRGMIAFYQTPLGKKMLDEMPAIMQESMAMGMAWGRKVGARVEARLKEKGIQQ